MKRALVIWGCVVVLGAAPNLALPDLEKLRLVQGVRVIPDSLRTDLFYTMPGDLVLATDVAGVPDLHLLIARYTGTVATGDRGERFVRSLMTLRLVRVDPSETELAAARRELETELRRRIELRPLPLRRTEAALVWQPLRPESTTPTASSTPASTPAPIPNGHFEASADGADGSPSGSIWRERIYTLSLDPETAQVMSDALAHGRIALSVGYAFFAEAAPRAEEVDPFAHLSGSPELVAEIKRRLGESAKRRGDEPAAQPPREVLVHANALAISIDPVRFPATVKKVELDAGAPPGYAALDLYCYDFADGQRADLLEKQVEIEAEAVSGRKTLLSVVFSRAQPDLYARALRFPVAVRLDRPYRYRTLEYDDSGEERISAWRESSSWADLLDVTTQVSTLPPAPQAVTPPAPGTPLPPTSPLESAGTRR